MELKLFETCAECQGRGERLINSYINSAACYTIKCPLCNGTGLKLTDDGKHLQTFMVKFVMPHVSVPKCGLLQGRE